MKYLYAFLAVSGIFLGSFTLAGAVSTFITQQGGTGTTSPSGILYGDNGATNHINTVKIGNNLTFSGGTLSATGGGTSAFEIATTSDIAVPGLAYFTKTSGRTTLGSVATTTLTLPAYMGYTGTLGALVGGSAGTLSINSLPIANGGTATTTGGFTNGATYFDGSTFTNTSLYRFDGTNLGIGTTTPGSLLSIGNLAGINFTGATSTLNTTGGININAGCFSQLGTCLQTYIQNATAYKQAVKYATAAVLPGTPSYSNGVSGVGATLTEVGFGALVVDGQTVVAGQRILVKNEADQTTNGIYTVTTVGSGIASYVLTRSTDYNTSADIYAGTTVPVLAGGNTNGDTQWTETTTGTITVGSSNIVFQESSLGTNVVASIAQTYGTAQIGAITLATSTTAIANDWGITNSSGTFTFNIPTATASIRGLLSGTDWTTFNSKLSANQSITLSGAVTGSGSTAITTAFGTLAQGILGNPFSAATIPTALATSTIFGDTATFLTTGNVGISSTTPGALFSVGNALTSGGYYFTTNGFGISSSTPGSPFSVLQGALTFIIKTTGAIIGYDAANGWNGRISPTHSFVLGSATTTTFTATSTGAYVPSLVMPFTGTLRTAQCQASTTQSFIGTNVQINNTNIVPKYFVSSSTVGTIAFTSANTFTKGDKVSVYFGTTTSDTANIYTNCTFNVTETP